SQIAMDAVADARVTQPERPISLEGAEAEVVVVGDQDRLRQVAANLVSNALTHTPAMVPVVVRVAKVGDRARLEVADSGPGLSAEGTKRAFERFFRGDAARSRGGVGLGLSIVAAIADAHGGKASVQSPPGAGAIFRVELPLAAPEGSRL
ncbi:MAG: sensor histidine kinase, partial [Acidimicrobiales bacterium]